MQNNQLSTNCHVQLEDNSIIFPVSGHFTVPSEMHFRLTISAISPVSSFSFQTSTNVDSASSSNVISSNGDSPHEEEGQVTGGSIVIDPLTGEARNASTGETMEIPDPTLPSPRASSSAPQPVPITEFQHLATESDLKVWVLLNVQIVSSAFAEDHILMEALHAPTCSAFCNVHWK